MRNPVTAVDFLSHQRGDDLWIVCPFRGCKWSKLVGGSFAIRDLLQIANGHLDEVNGHNVSTIWAEAMHRKWNR
jgi:hypothetical protein